MINIRKILTFISFCFLFSCSYNINKGDKTINITSSEDTYILVNGWIKKTPTNVIVRKNLKTIEILDKNNERREVYLDTKTSNAFLYGNILCIPAINILSPVCWFTDKAFGYDSLVQDTYIDLNNLKTAKDEDIYHKRYKKITKQKPLVFGRLRIYQTFDDGQTREVSNSCSYSGSGFKGIGLFATKVRYADSKPHTRIRSFKDSYKRIDKGGLIVVSLDDDSFNINGLNCDFFINNDAEQPNHIANFITDFEINLKDIDISKTTYFGDINLFIRPKPSDSKIFSCVGTGCPYNNLIYNYFNVKKITISNNLEKTKGSLEYYYDGIKNNTSITTNLAKMKKNGHDKDIKKATNLMPF
ncbi:hypothetical protein ACFL0U_01290 [Pseudomonadota bacterium]